MHGFGADYISIALAAIRERKHKLFQLLATNSLVRTETKLDARLGECAMKRHELLVVKDRGEHSILHVCSASRRGDKGCWRAITINLNDDPMPG